MSISGSTGTSLLQSVLDSQTRRADTEVALLKKAQNVMKSQGHAMIEMLEQAGSAGKNQSGQLLDVYA
jgi:hypothetical protein